MPAKSSAYEKGIREGRAMAARSRNPEASEPEEEEEEEEMDMEGKQHSRKRSAKGAKHTKPAKDGGMYGKKPMDAECGCGRKGKCDGNCGSMRKRRDSLTPLEYLDACELGIQDRSTAYIRARLDSTERLDLKCGKGSISEGEKCTKGTAQRVEPKKPTNKEIRQMERNLIAKAARTGQPLKTSKKQTALLLQTRGTQTRRTTKQILTKVKSSALKAAIKENKNSKDPQNQALSSLARRELFNRRVQTGARVLGGALATGAVVASSLETRKRDSMYAAGFSPEHEQLAI